jgi:F-type H+-transporting ATPase subunit delta
VQALVERGQFTPPVGKLLVMLAERDRLTLLPAVLEAFRARLRDQQQVLEAEVTTAIPLEPQQEAALQQRLSAATAREVTVTTKGRSGARSAASSRASAPRCTTAAWRHSWRS